MNFALLTVFADLLDDLEHSRVATTNRIRALREIKGMADSPEEARLSAIADVLAEAEKKAAKELAKAVKAHPLGEWIKAQHGVGEKQAGRLLGVLGDPYLRLDPETGELTSRRVSDLWSYCGYGDAAAQVRRRGERSNWNAALKMRAHLIAVSCMKSGKGPYRKVYDDARKKYKDAVHAADCKRCGPSGKPAKKGTPLSDGHKNARALRAVAKAFLKDLWLEGRRIHGSVDPQDSNDPAPHPEVA